MALAVAALLVSGGRSMVEMLLRVAGLGGRGCAHKRAERGAESPAWSPSALWFPSPPGRPRPFGSKAGFPKSYAHPPPSMPVLDSSPPDSPKLGPQERKAVARLLPALPPVADERGALFARHGHEL